jgi:predicted O-methyltransferase YrrM
MPSVDAMTNTLARDNVSAVLQRMLRAEQDNDPAAFAAAGRASDAPLTLGAVARAELFKDVYMSVSAAGGELLYLLARAAGARSVVEFGTSFGVSTLYLASAVRDNGGGTVVGTELHADKAAAAQRNFDDAGLSEIIDLRVGDALSTLADLDRDVDLLLLDGWPDAELAVLELLEPRLHPGSVVVVDDVDLDVNGDTQAALLRHLAGSPDYAGLKLPVGDGIQVCVRV